MEEGDENEDAICLLCRDAFSIDEENDPSNLKVPLRGSCTHNYCKECVINLHLSRLEKSRRHVVNLKCPECRQPSFRADKHQVDHVLCRSLRRIRHYKSQLVKIRNYVQDIVSIESHSIDASTDVGGASRHRRNSESRFRKVVPEEQDQSSVRDDASMVSQKNDDDRDGLNHEATSNAQNLSADDESRSGSATSGSPSGSGSANSGSGSIRMENYRVDSFTSSPTKRSIHDVVPPKSDKKRQTKRHKGTSTHEMPISNIKLKEGQEVKREADTSISTNDLSPNTFTSGPTTARMGNKQVPNESALTNAHRRNTNTNTREAFQCLFCEKDFPSKRTLDCHIECMCKERKRAIADKSGISDSDNSKERKEDGNDKDNDFAGASDANKQGTCDTPKHRYCDDVGAKKPEIPRDANGSNSSYSIGGNIRERIMAADLNKLRRIDAIIRFMDEIEPGKRYYARQEDDQGQCSVIMRMLRDYANKDENAGDIAVAHWQDTKNWAPPSHKALVALIKLNKIMIDRIEIKDLKNIMRRNEEVYGKERALTAASHDDLARAYYKRGKYADALKYHEKCLAIREKVLGKKHKSTATSYHNIGAVYDKQGKYADALKYYEKCLVIREKVLGKKHKSTATTYHNIGWVYDNQGKYADALKYYEKCLAIREKVLGEEHESTATSYHNIGGVYDNQGKYDDALKYYEKCLAIEEKVLGEEHESTATTYHNIGGVYDNQGKYADALKYYEKCLVIREKVLGMEHESTATTYHNIGWVYDKQGKYADALKYYEKCLAIEEKVLGEEHESTATSYHNIGGVYDNQGKYADALKYYEKCLVIREKVLGMEHESTATTYHNIGAVYDKQGKYADALKYYEKCLAIDEKVLGMEHELTADSYYNIADCYECQGDLQKALEYYEKCLTAEEIIYGKDHSEPLSTKSKIDELMNKIK